MEREKKTEREKERVRDRDRENEAVREILKICRSLTQRVVSVAVFYVYM